MADIMERQVIAVALLSVIRAVSRRLLRDVHTPPRRNNPYLPLYNLRGWILGGVLMPDHEHTQEGSDELSSGKTRTVSLKKTTSRNPDGAPVRNWIPPIPLSPHELARIIMTTPPTALKPR